jgi:hypothetical protein
MGAGTDVVIVIDGGGGIEDDTVFDGGGGVDDGAGHDGDGGAKFGAWGEGGVAADGVGEGEAKGLEVGDHAMADAIAADGGEGVGDPGGEETRELVVVAEVGVVEEGVGGRERGEAGDFEGGGFFEDFRDDFRMAAGTEDDEAGLLHEADFHFSMLNGVY